MSVMAPGTVLVKVEASPWLWIWSLKHLKQVSKRFRLVLSKDSWIFSKLMRFHACGRNPVS